jgi:hypothetical protein
MIMTMASSTRVKPACDRMCLDIFFSLLEMTRTCF